MKYINTFKMCVMMVSSMKKKLMQSKEIVMEV